MANKTQTIRIESILGGHSPMTHFAAPDQFRASLNINPALAINDNEDKFGYGPSGLLRPTAVRETTKEVLNDEPMFIISTPKNNATYVYGHYGSLYTTGGGVFGLTTAYLGTTTDGAISFAEGAAYYDNYVYFATSTNVARYGPLDGGPALTKDYWVATLGKAQLTAHQFPNDATLGLIYPAHPLHRHSDGKLYIGDSSGGNGVIHYIATTKTTVEGDTDNGSTFQKLTLGYGLIPSALETYGPSLVIAILERASGNNNNGDTKTGAKIAFWDTTSQNINSINWNSFPDGFISSLKNINGVLYAVSGSFNDAGFRVSKYVGGDSFEEVAYFENGQTPFPGAVDGDANRLLFGSRTDVPESRGCVWSYNLQNSKIGGLYNVQGVTASSSVGLVTSLSLNNSLPLNANVPAFVGWTVNETPGVGYHGIDANENNNSPENYSLVPSNWWSQLYRIGQRFKITKIRIPLAQTIASNMTITPKIYTDDGVGTTYTLSTIDNTNYSGKKSVVIRPENLTGDHNFWLELRWTGSELCVVNLPITIEYELIDD